LNFIGIGFIGFNTRVNFSLCLSFVIATTPIRLTRSLLSNPTLRAGKAKKWEQSLAARVAHGLLKRESCDLEKGR
jgi:hypothetical protein